MESLEIWKLVIAFATGGLAGAILKQVVDSYRNKIQKLICYYIKDEVISKLPIRNGDIEHNNLQSKVFLIKNTTNKDIDLIKVIFTFEVGSVITKNVSYSKLGYDIPKGNVVQGKKNECSFTIKQLNRKEKIEIYFEIGNVSEDKLNITESSCKGIKIKYKDKRRRQARKEVKIVEKKDLSHTLIENKF